MEKSPTTVVDGGSDAAPRNSIDAGLGRSARSLETGMEQSEVKTETQAPRWREHLAIHPAAELFPPLTDDELRELADDINMRGLRQKVLVEPEDDGSLTLLDGRSRLDALELAGQTIILDGKLRVDLYEEAPTSVEPEDLVVSLNIRRRHLNAEQKRNVIEALLKLHPDRSNRAIGKDLGADHKTVGAVRCGMESTGEIPQLTERLSADGKTRPASPTPRQKESTDEEASCSEDHEVKRRPPPTSQKPCSTLEVTFSPKSSIVVKTAATKRWLKMTAQRFKAPALELYEDAIAFVQLLGDAKHKAEISRPERWELLRKLAAQLDISDALKDSDLTSDGTKGRVGTS